MTETLRDKEEMLRIESENVRKAREELALLKRKVEQHDEIMAEKDRGVQVRPGVSALLNDFSPICSVCMFLLLSGLARRDSVIEPRAEPSHRPQ